MSNEIDKPFCYRYPHPAMTADCVIFGFDGEQLKVLLIERGLEPYMGMWALPGGFMKIDETIEQAAARELFEETGLQGVFLEQFKVYSTVDRDPRERVVTVAFIALVHPEEYRLTAGDDAANALWFGINSLPPMAFDHIDIIHDARLHLAETLRLRPVAFELLNKYFSISELQRVYEAINNTSYDRRNFQRKALQSGIIRKVEPDVLPSPTIACCETAPMPQSIRPGRNADLYVADDSAIAPGVQCEAEEDCDIDANSTQAGDKRSLPRSIKGLFEY